MTAEQIIEHARARDVERLRQANSSLVVDALNLLKDGGRKDKQAAAWLRENYKKQRSIK